MVVAAGLALVCGAESPAVAQGGAAGERPAVEVDLSVLDTLGPPPARPPLWTPPLPDHRPAAPARVAAAPVPRVEPAPRPIAVALAPPEPSAAQAAEQPAAAAASPAPAAAPRPPARRLAEPPLQLRQPVAEGNGAAPSEPPPTDEKIAAVPLDVEAVTDGISALPSGDGFRIVFDSDAEEFSETGARLLSGIAQRMVDDPSIRIQVRAYAGGTPETASQARRLSLNRALAVRTFLTDRGVRGTRIDVRALGNTAPGEPKERVDLLLSE